MAYDETKVLRADIGKHLVVARRKDDVWYVAGICGKEGCTGGFMLDFLGRGSHWKAHLFADGEKGLVEYSERAVVGGSWFPVRMDGSGGFALLLTRMDPVAGR
jgi:alpha-glucosidase